MLHSPTSPWHQRKQPLRGSLQHQHHPVTASCKQRAVSGTHPRRSARSVTSPALPSRPSAARAPSHQDTPLSGAPEEVSLSISRKRFPWLFTNGAAALADLQSRAVYGELVRQSSCRISYGCVPLRFTWLRANFPDCASIVAKPSRAPRHRF